MSITGTPQSAPLKAGPPIMDYATGIAAAYAIASALYQRTHTGTGQYIDLGMLDVSLMLMASVATAYLNTGVPPKPAGNAASSRAPASTTFNTAEGLLAIACNEEHQFRHLLDVLGLAALRSDPRYAEPAKRKENVMALRAEIQNALMRRTAAEWETALNAACVPAGRVRTVAECLAEPQVASRIAFHTFSAAASGFGSEVTVPLSPFRFAHDGPRATRAPAAAGADSEAILRELGYDGSAIEVLKAKQVI
jgi:crotonobetainyl-CoA:carnitine CoA-transferase CaiB-like acyl-CoA transferase